MPQPQPLSLLLIEDSKHDAELALIVLERAGYAVDAQVVHDRDGMEQALSHHSFDLIVSDFVLPAFSGAQALRLAREQAGQTPFIFFSGVFGEAHAVEMMRLGATDYVLKQNLSLLPKAVERALGEVHGRNERQRGTSALDKTDLQSRLAIEAARLGIWDYDPQADAFEWDARCRQLLGVPDSVQASWGLFLERVHPEDRERVRIGMQRVLDTSYSGSYTDEYRVALPGGRLRWLAVRGRSIAREGRCQRFTGVLMDVTSERLATQALRQQNVVLGERVEARTRERDRTWALSRDILFIADFDLRMQSINPAWSQVLGWSESDVTSMASLMEIVHPEDFGSTRQTIESLGQGAIVTRFVNRLRHVDGSYRWISWSAVPDGGMIYASGRDISRDMLAVEELAAANLKLTEQIEERERVETALRQMQRLEAVGQLTAGVAHDFNNLLVVILSSIGMLERELASMNVPPRMLQRLANVRDAGERGAKLTTQLLAFARRQQLEPRVLDLNEAITAMLGLLRSTLGSSITIETRFEDGVWPTLADPTQLELIVLNLAINARDAMTQGGVLELSTQNCRVVERSDRPEEPEPGDYVALEVSDNGTGMPPDVLAKAFEPFFTTKEIGKGSGLGLAQVFGFAKQTGGGVRIRTRLGAGTSVTVMLPRHDDELQREPAPPEPAPSAERVVAETAVSVLLVDDDDAVREVTAILLEDRGCVVAQASSGAAALALLEENAEVDVMLTDFAMPAMNGAELARRARALRPGLPVIFVTGYAELQGLDIGDAQVLQKPFNENELLDRIQRAARDVG
ncbi:response regulator [Verticiella sediminum]|uniref:histidine kinase n=1 Tax=Verticiella sediminum TaxID=1247510 RepID=A0A556AY76_9BURK|nr:hybrid sensor histidine kinase/response regulator [Verticiella sediminum]TSH97881.1 response regulator [Verticiella sediminum]